MAHQLTRSDIKTRKSERRSRFTTLGYACQALTPPPSDAMAALSAVTNKPMDVSESIVETPANTLIGLNYILPFLCIFDIFSRLSVKPRS